ncbi:hypothetical protein Vadar_020811 [Vaccinium darrowii]|uniref:Uncharacterized protein n=1 Tax=Vaccinium darrowii TaxID=229202 RepID=A0ACB7XRY7_9ERIC|nr:hypothetical protein Vadar_020811 [Vaccinium darrowii]
MVVGRGEKIGKDSFKAGYLKKLEGMLVVALPVTEIRAYPHIASKIKRDSNANGLRFKTFLYYEDWCIIFGNDRATREMAESAIDMVEAIDIEGDADEDGDGSTTMSNSTLQMLGGRMGYAHDLSAKRSVVNAELAKLPITTVDRVKAHLAITKDAQTVYSFFSLKRRKRN